MSRTGQGERVLMLGQPVHIRIFFSMILLRTPGETLQKLEPFCYWMLKIEEAPRCFHARVVKAESLTAKKKKKERKKTQKDKKLTGLTPLRELAGYETPSGGWSPDFRRHWV